MGLIDLKWLVHVGICDESIVVIVVIASSLTISV
jgi:hypothetical protein